ncbi:cyclin family protein [Striga asiatica]|uniref:Cyclin family protein n=1 Tax=Striga asiatica TaxID=4170 RepID=A0A5A7PA77_STRAF|nr:cyclin family protein [Striga asiatica]
METSGPDADRISSNDYAALGLKDSRKDNIGNPRILSLLGMLLEKSVQKNERLFETSQIKDAITIFHGSRAPAISIQLYIDRIFKYSCCSPSCFLIAHIYMERFIQRTNFFLTSLNIHRLLVTSVMVAAKFMDDSFFNNAYYARVGGVSTSEMNKLEKKFLFSLDFRLYVNVNTFGKYCSVFKREGSSGRIERPIKSCGVEESWTNKDDPAHGQSTAR